MNIEDISIDNKKYRKYRRVYTYALNMLKRELFQSCEGLLANLNSLQSRSGEI